MVQYFPVVTGSLTVNGDISVSGNVVVTGSMSGTSSLAANAELLSGTGSVGFTTTSSFTVASSSLSSRTTQIEAVYATTGSNSFRATQSITGSLTVTGQIVAQTLNVQQVTSSIVYSSGSNVFGCDINSRQTFTGSFYQTGSVAIFSNTVCASNITFCSNINGGLTAIRICNPNPGTSAYSDIAFFNDTSNQAGLFYNSSTRSTDGGVCTFSLYNDSATGNIRLRTGCNIILATGSPSATDRLIVSANGNIGIGTNTPTFGKLSIYCVDDTTLSSALWGTSTGAGLVAAVYNGSTTNNSVAGIRLITRNSGASVWNMYNVSRGNDTGDLAFGNGSGGAGTERMRLTNGGNLGINTQAPQAGIHSFGPNDRAPIVLQTGSQNYIMFGKMIQSYGGVSNTPLFILCPGGNNGTMVKIDVRGVNAVGNIAYTSTMYAFQYRIGGGLQATNVVTCGGVNLGNPGYSAGTLCWCNAASSAPVLVYSQNNNGYIIEGLDVYVTTRDSAEVYFCTNYVNAG